MTNPVMRSTSFSLFFSFLAWRKRRIVSRFYSVGVLVNSGRGWATMCTRTELESRRTTPWRIREAGENVLRVLFLGHHIRHPPILVSPATRTWCWGEDVMGGREVRSSSLRSSSHQLSVPMSRKERKERFPQQGVSAGLLAHERFSYFANILI